MSDHAHYVAATEALARARTALYQFRARIGRLPDLTRPMDLRVDGDVIRYPGGAGGPPEIVVMPDEWPTAGQVVKVVRDYQEAWRAVMAAFKTLPSETRRLMELGLPPVEETDP